MRIACVTRVMLFEAQNKICSACWRVQASCRGWGGGCRRERAIAGAINYMTRMDITKVSRPSSKFQFF